MSTMSADDVATLRSRLAQHIMSMDDAELAIKAKSQESLIDFLYGVIGAIAGAMGYVIGAIVGIAEGIVLSFADGMRAGYDAGRRAARGQR